MVDSITGIWDGIAITGILAVNTYPNGGNDNLLPITNAGLAFNLASAMSGGSTSVDVNNYGYQSPHAYQGSGGVDFGCGTFSTTSPSAVPEPASMAVLGAGVAGLLTASRRRRRKAA